MAGIGTFRVLMKTIFNIEIYSPLKPTKVGFIFIGPNSFSRDLDTAHHVKKAVVRLQSWV